MEKQNWNLEPDSRREFLANLVSGAATATVLMVIGPGASADHGVGGHSKTHRDLVYVINVNNCIGCGNCVRACKRENSVPSEYFRTWVERYIITEKGIYIDSPKGAIEGFKAVNAEIRSESKLARTIPKMCNHCDNSPCIQVCPVGATYRTDDGFVLVDHEHCVGCAYCVQACPYGARFINPEIKKADKCTWCYHRVKAGKLPACVTVCPNKARLFGNLHDPDSEVTKVFNEDRWMTLRPEMHTHPYCFYVGLPREVR
jgi:Fe-S-cluster-containing dehydrogenase component